MTTMNEIERLKSILSNSYQTVSGNNNNIPAKLPQELKQKAFWCQKSIESHRRHDLGPGDHDGDYLA
jgi:hypothetical protein